MVLPLGGPAVAGLQAQQPMGLVHEMGIMGAHHHQPLPGALQDRPHPRGGFRIEEGGGLIELHRLGLLRAWLQDRHPSKSAASWGA